MNKIFFTMMMLVGLCFANSLDVNQAKIEWKGFKFANKTVVKGSFGNVFFQFPKNTTNLTSALLGATAKIDLDKVLTGNPMSEKNLTKSFFSKFNGKNILAKIEGVTEGDKQGAILLEVNMNQVKQFIPMQYVIADGKLVANGVIELMNFGLKDAFESLKKTCNTFHQNFTWSQVEISLIIPAK